MLHAMLSSSLYAVLNILILARRLNRISTFPLVWNEVDWFVGTNIQIVAVRTGRFRMKFLRFYPSFVLFKDLHNKLRLSSSTNYTGSMATSKHFNIEKAQ